MPDAAPPDASSDDPDEPSTSGEDAPAVIRTAIDALDAMLGPPLTDDRDGAADASAEDAESDPR